jgi:uncharacterized protein with PQ loop repeat
MILFLHIISAIAGMLGSYIWAWQFFKKNRKKNSEDGAQPAEATSRFGQWLTYCGLVVVMVTGAWLFIEKPAVFLQSGKFLSNMVILLILLGVEFSWYKSYAARSLYRYISVFSWTWIFGAALWNPPFAFSTFMLAYGGVLTLIIFVFIYRQTSRRS